jgi:AcrR family transcriptional regulator
VTVLYGAQTPRRRDALRNRSSIVQAAGEVMTTQRPVVGMPEIARGAGVGVATLYRHFPDRYALASAVIADQINRLDAFVQAAGDEPAVFRRIVDEMLRTQITMRPLVLLARGLDPGTRGRHLRRVLTVLAAPLRAAQQCGYVRSDLQPADFALLFTIVEGVVAGTEDVDAARTAAGRTIELALDGVFLTHPG